MVQPEVLGEERMKRSKRDYMEYCILAVITLICYLMVIQIFTGQYMWEHNSYNTYALQADSWRQGRLDLGENYSWLEIAEYNGKFYCSFPPFPSYVIFPFTFFFGSDTPDSLILLFFDIMAVVYLYKIAAKLKLSPAASAFCALFFIISTNMAFVVHTASVWFLAQSMCFALATAAIYYALIGKGGLSLLFWSFGVGCRPMQALYVPVLLYLLFQSERRKHPEEKWYLLIKNKLYWAVPAVIVALSYMILNYARFGNVAEFGHNYLPEFVEEHVQFSKEYLSNNFRMLMNLPDFSEDGRMMIDHFGNLNFLWVNPPVLAALLGFVVACIRKEKHIIILNAVAILMSVVYLIVTMMHATMGGWHFGNRYTNDILPWMFICLMPVLAKNKRLIKWQLPFAVWGIMFNVVGTVIVYNGLGR